MQAVIDRVIRSFTFNSRITLTEQMLDEPRTMMRDEATDLATRLLENYQGHLVRRSQKKD